MGLLQAITGADAPLAGWAELGALGAAFAIGLGLIALVGALGVWWRRLEEGSDPRRSLAPPVGQLRLARELEMRNPTD
jgi:hypothetical protein